MTCFGLMPYVPSPIVPRMRLRAPTGGWLPPGTLPNRTQLNFWMSSADHQLVSGLHRDDSPNLLTVLRGRKRVTLLPPSALPGLYCVSQVDRPATWAAMTWRPGSMAYHANANNE